MYVVDDFYPGITIQVAERLLLMVIGDFVNAVRHLQADPVLAERRALREQPRRARQLLGDDSDGGVVILFCAPNCAT